MGLQQSEAVLTFLRHGQQEPANFGGVPHASGLTERGRDEARQVGAALAVEQHKTVAYSVNNPRSLASVALAFSPETSDDQITSMVEALLENRRIIPHSSLSYAPIQDQVFQDGLSNAFAQGRALRFLVDNSDDFRLSTGSDMSSYSAMAYDVAKTLNNYHGVLRNGEQLDAETLYRLFCGREFIPAAFRAKLIENTEGIDARDEYIEWYGSTVEWSDAARVSLATATISEPSENDARIYVSDAYGGAEVSLVDIKRIMRDFETRFLKIDAEGGIV